MSTLMINNVKIGEGVPKIIVPIVGKTEEEILDEAELVKALTPDVVEWRVDFFDQADNLYAVTKLIGKLKKSLQDTPLLFTFRTLKEGGNKEITDQYYIELIRTAVETKKVDLVDIELFSGEEAIVILLSVAKKNGVFVIMSNHEFLKTPKKDEIIARLQKMQGYGADIPKIAVMPTSTADVLTLLDATNTMKEHFATGPFMTMAMGSLGLISRLAGEVFGSALTFAAGKEASAPGQIPVKDLRSVLKVLHKCK